MTGVMKTVQTLCQEIGPRPVGSAGNLRAAEYIQDALAALWLKVERQAFPCPMWTELRTRLDLAGVKLAATANPFSPSGEVSAPAVFVSTLVELEAVNLTDCISVLHGELVQGGLSNRHAAYFPERDQRVLQLLEEKKPAGIVTISPKTGEFERILYDWDLAIPSVSVPAEVGLSILGRPGQLLNLSIESQSEQGEFFNVIASKPGRRADKIVLCAHFDTKHGSPGADDNASGVAVLLALAERFSEREIHASLEWIAFNGEEAGGLGDVAYLQQREAEFGQILAAINMDGVGSYLGATSVTGLACSSAIQEAVQALVREHPGATWIDPWYESNHSTFWPRGVPSLAISTLGGAQVHHTFADTREWISEKRLEAVVDLVEGMVELIQDKPLHWGREVTTAN